MHQGLPLLIEGTGVGGIHNVCQIHAHGDGSVKELPAEVPGGLWDQGRIQICPPGTLIFAEHVLPLGVRAGHEDRMVEGADHEHIELAVMSGSEADQLHIPQPSKMVKYVSA